MNPNLGERFRIEIQPVPLVETPAIALLELPVERLESVQFGKPSLMVEDRVPSCSGSTCYVLLDTDR